MKHKPLLQPACVNGTVISAERIAAEAQNHPAPGGKPGLAWKAARQALVLREVLLQEAVARGIAPEPAEIDDGRWETDEDSQIRQLLDEAVNPAPPDDDALRTFYDENPDRFRAPSLYEAAHILIPAAPDDANARAGARDRAVALCSTLVRDPAAFARLAAEHSACSSRQNGGRLGQITSGDTVREFEAALAQMDEGEISTEPVETRYGFHLLRLDARAKGEVLPFAAVLPQLRLAQEKANWIRASRDFAADLLARAEM
ncbi:peptidylprolyl isomerase [Tropicimonas sp.]|uniref:peptidylprolyl isomerase n=1 Tax=Tropicimonas sp. TaxID=2067044 RepID=UPI003A899BFC